MRRGSGRIHELKGFGEKTEQKILAALEKPIVTEKRFKLSVAEEEAQALLALSEAQRGKGEIAVAGSYRRRRETVGDLDIVATAAQDGRRRRSPRQVRQRRRGARARCHAHDRRLAFRDCRSISASYPRTSYGAALLYFTGSKSAQYRLARLGQ